MPRGPGIRLAAVAVFVKVVPPELTARSAVGAASAPDVVGRTIGANQGSTNAVEDVALRPIASFAVPGTACTPHTFRGGAGVVMALRSAQFVSAPRTTTRPGRMSALSSTGA